MKTTSHIAVVIIILGCTSVFSQDILITVYNQNFTLVREARELALDTGVSTVSFTEVAAKIDPTSVHFKSLTSPDKLTILEQNYEYDLVSPQKMLLKYVDEAIRVVTEKGEVFSGMLLNTSGSDVVIQTEGGSIQVLKGGSIQHFDFPELPEGLITRPTLVWMVKNNGPKKQKTELSYLTNGMNWHAEYVAVVAPDDKSLGMSGWVSIENQSGATYDDAKLKLVAGDVHRVEEGRGRRVYKDDRALAMAAEAPQFEEKAFFEYHLYTLQRPATVKNNQTKQISLFPPTDTKAEKIFIYDGSYFGNKVRVNMAFENSEEDGLGMSLPKGKIRVYKEDTDGALEFVGEDLIDHTPVDEKVKIFLGNAFDLVGERVQKASRKISDRAREDEVEITHRNHKEEKVEIVVVEHLWGDWKIIKKSHPFKKKDAGTAEFTISVTSGGEVTLKYTALYEW